MTKPKDGGAAFPVDYIEGMSLRDWFAGRAMTGCLPGIGLDAAFVEERAMLAYRIADAMLAEREGGGE